GCGRRHEVLPSLTFGHASSDFPCTYALLFGGFYPEHFHVQPQRLKHIEFPLSPIVVDSQIKDGIEREIEAIEFRKIYRKGHYRKLRRVQTTLEHDLPNNAVALEICEWISFRRTPIGIGRIDPCEGGIRVGDSDHQLPAPLPGSQDIFQMIEMENLKTAMNDTSLCHNRPATSERVRVSVSEKNASEDNDVWVQCKIG